MSIVKFLPFIFAGIMSNNTPALDTGAVYYVVVIDAGSSGSRVHAYKFSLPTRIGRQRRNTKRKLRLDDELYVAENPGLSAFTKYPKAGANSIVKLIKKANAFVPKNKRAKTPLIVRATGGLRSLPKEISRNILAHIRKGVANLGYNLTHHSVDILHGQDEGINMWYAVNLLTDTLGKTNTMSSLEMGGASAQVTFALNPGKLNNLSEGMFVRPAVFNHTIFSHSYQGQGIDEARLGTLQLEAGDVKTERFISVCTDPSPTEYEKNFLGRNLKIRGVSRKGYSPKEVYLRCQKFVKAYIKMTMTNVLQLRGLKKIAAMGYYYHFANNEGLIPHNKNGKTTIQKLLAHAQSPKGGCASYDMQNPWRCFDVVFIVSLLQYGYGIDKNTIIHLYDKIDGYSVHWSLGVAYNYVMAEITAKPGLDDMQNYLQEILSRK